MEIKDWIQIIVEVIQNTYENIKIYDNLDEFLICALAMDMWEDLSIPDKITNYLWEDNKINFGYIPGALFYQQEQL